MDDGRRHDRAGRRRPCAATLPTTSSPADAGPVRLTWTLRSRRRPGASASSPTRSRSLADRRTRTRRWTSGEVAGDAQVAVVAPGGPLASREVRYYRVRVRSSDGWSAWSDAVRRRGRPARARPTGSARRSRCPDDPGAIDAVAVAAPAPGVRGRRRRSGEPGCTSRRSASTGSPSTGRRVSDDLLGPGLDAVRQAAPRRDVRRHRPARSSARTCIGAVLGDGWYRGRLGWERDDEPQHATARRSALLAQLEIDARRTGRRRSIATDGVVAGLDRRDPLAPTCTTAAHIDLRERQAGWDRPGFDDRGVATGRDRAVRPLASSSRASRRRSGSSPTLPCAIAPLARRSGWRLDARPERRRLGAAARSRVGAATTVTVRHAEVLEPDGSLHTRSLRSAKATDTYVLADDADRSSSNRPSPSTASATPRSDGDVELLDAVGRRHQLGRRRRAAGSPARTRCSSASTRTSCGRCATTSCRSRPTARSATSGSAGPATPRPSRRPRRSSSTARRSGRAGCATSRSSRTRSSASRRVVPDVVLTGEPRFGRAGWSDAATIVPWAVYEAYGDRRDPSRRSSPACAPMSTRSTPDARPTASCPRRCSSATGSTRTPHRIDRGWRRPTAGTSPTPSSSTARG